MLLILAYHKELTAETSSMKETNTAPLLLSKGNRNLHPAAQFLILYMKKVNSKKRSYNSIYELELSITWVNKFKSGLQNNTRVNHISKYYYSKL